MQIKHTHFKTLLHLMFTGLPKRFCSEIPLGLGNERKCFKLQTFMEIELYPSQLFTHRYTVKILAESAK